SSLGRSSVRAVQRILPTILDTMLTRAVMPPALTPVATVRFHRAARVLRRTIRNVIAQSRRDGESSSLTARLMAARDPETGQSLTDVDVLDEDATMLFAGTETTASTLAWAMDHLARHPEAEKRMRTEIDRVLGDRQVTYQDVAKLKFTEAVVQEALRQHGVVLLMRRTHAPVTLSGVRIPAGTEVAFSLYAMHRDPAVYRDPDTFDPDRWSPEGRAAMCPHAHMPFGAGTRKCIGDRFSVVENVITLATLYQRGRFATVPGRPAPRERLAGLAGPDGVYLSWQPHARSERAAA
ncbi:MAG TPA: cytochrome P450, partial [Streptomyces sp.]|nr:cytochrome P450 [Streptomyces sp.]